MESILKHPLTTKLFSILVETEHFEQPTNNIWMLDATPLTPNHFILLKSEGLSRNTYGSKDALKRRFKQVQHIVDTLWIRFSKEYIANLALRQKWCKEMPDLKIGDIVLLSQNMTRRNAWPLAIVLEIYPCTDQHVRSVKVKTSTGTYIRPITKLVRLEVN